ncbi:response regulator [Sabulicella rubraurantiaca]|uniref:response regulator n=1 Tax=Sabulicella rubraurantiaca TaxID=2811429 RepID=UPI001A965E58|nr:response regulator [Sabulicella rubraurantiaca]
MPWHDFGLKSQEATGGTTISQIGMLMRRAILVVEDEYLIARDLAEELEHVGVKVLGPVATLSAALRLVARSGRIDAAVLDVKLGAESVYPVADALRRRGIPLVFCAGYNRGAHAPAFRGALLYEKPSDPAAIRAALGMARMRDGSRQRCLVALRAVRTG